jgi:hypothetical protein
MEPVDTLAAIPDSPKHVSATDGTIDNNVQITWDPGVGAASYNLYVSESASSKGILVEQVSSAQSSMMAWCDPARLQPGQACDNSFYASAAAATYMAGVKDGRNLYFTVASQNSLGESSGNKQDIGYPNIPTTSSTVTIKADFNGSGSAIPVIVDQNQTDVFVVALTSQPDGAGTVTLDPSTNRMTFTAAPGFTGSKPFTYTVTDKGGTPYNATGNAVVTCPSPVLTSLTSSPYPAIASGTLTLKYTNASVNIQLFNGAQPANILANAAQGRYQHIATGTDQTIAVPFSNVASANYTAIVTVKDTVQGIQTQSNFSIPLLDMSRAYYELNTPNWAPHAFIGFCRIGGGAR